MRVSRTPERRGGANKSVMYFALVIAALLIGILVTYITTGLGSTSAKGDQGDVLTSAAEPAPPVNTGFAALPTLATPVPTAAPTPVAPVVVAEVVEVETSLYPGFVPDVSFGEVLSEGFVEIDLPSHKGVESWYTFQVDTTSREITLFFALYSEERDSLVRTVKVEGYSQGQILDNAEITVFYPGGPERILGFDGTQGIMTISQQFANPRGPSLFSPELRVALVNYGISLQDASGTIHTQLHLDVSGLSNTEGMVLSRSEPDLVDSVLTEVQLLVDQIESLRDK
ncbi:MAG: hypothetical protein ACE5Q6_04720 [Dehalococcoidia bacterium]